MSGEAGTRHKAQGARNQVKQAQGARRKESGEAGTRHKAQGSRREESGGRLECWKNGIVVRESKYSAYF